MGGGSYCRPPGLPATSAPQPLTDGGGVLGRAGRPTGLPPDPPREKKIKKKNARQVNPPKGDAERPLARPPGRQVNPRARVKRREPVPRHAPRGRKRGRGPAAPPAPLPLFPTPRRRRRGAGEGRNERTNEPRNKRSGAGSRPTGPPDPAPRRGAATRARARAPRSDKSLCRGLTLNRSQRGSCSATYETPTQNQVVYE